MFVVGGIQTALFLGGWNDPFGLIGYFYRQCMTDPAAHSGALILLNVIAAGIFATKCMGIMFVQMWLRWTLPRPRIDQVLYACVKVLLPMACVILLGAAIWELLVPERQGIPWFDYNPWSLAGWQGALGSLVTQIILTVLGIGGFLAIVLWVFYAFASGRNLKQRLTDPAPIETEAPEPA
jgi:hypothetical protein